MKFRDVSLLSVGYLLPPEVVTSDQIEARLDPVYQRLRLPQGRLEGMSGIRSRRLWSPGTRITDMSAKSALLALDAARLDASEIGCLIHASVCREYLEPATACRVHCLVGIPADAWVYDVSNACLGVMNGAVQIAMLIDAGVIDAGIVVGTEDSRGLLEATLAHLLADSTLTRQSIKPAFASLTIGSGSCAWVLGRTSKYGAMGQDGVAQQGARILAASAVARTEHHGLCQSDTDQAGASMNPIMNTDSEQLLEAGLETGAESFEQLLQQVGWSRPEIDRTVCHQVGTVHRRRMLERLGLAIENDFCTFEEWGNTGSVALPTALGVGLSQNWFLPNSKLALLGIGSGLNSVMLAMDYQTVSTRFETL